MARYRYFGQEFADIYEVMEYYYENVKQIYLESILHDYDASEILHHLDEDFLDTLTQRARELFMERVKVIDDDEEEEGE